MNKRIKTFEDFNFSDDEMNTEDWPKPKVKSLPEIEMDREEWPDAPDISKKEDKKKKEEKRKPIEPPTKL